MRAFATFAACGVLLFAVQASAVHMPEGNDLAKLAVAQKEADRATFDALHDPIPALRDQVGGLLQSTVRLPLAAALGAALAFRPRRRGTPPRQAAVIQTQILLSVVGAVVMLIVGQSLARAFGIVGVASLVRYRAKVDDPKDAGVMLATLGIGLASGVGLYLIAIFATVFLLGFLWWVESFEPRARRRFHLKVTVPDPEQLRPQLEALLRGQRAPFDVRTLSSEELTYEVRLPFETRTEDLSNAIAALDASGKLAVEWEEKKAA
ncbi:MAG TPA: DUF4956 domain-containing protein [Myxococcota bacterium]|jgi:uncharacterized membrane protein YhiD involved in acid resistance|nr:DUF4956 domain-containing protein [Myxococcota bacterium]